MTRKNGKNGTDSPRAAASPVGIFDSGIGGLTVLREFRRELPAEDVVYFGDTAHLPYGTKSKETITKFSVDNVGFLQGFGVKLVIVACNTASSLSLDALKDKFTLPIIGVIEPGARQALKMTKNGRVGVIGTKATIGSGSYEAQLKKLDPSVKVYSESCPLFVPLVEEGWLDGEVTERIARTYLDPLKNFKIDTLILGCTHYPLLERVIRKTLGDKVKLVNSAEETAREAKELLGRGSLLAAKKKTSDTRFYVSDEPEQFRNLGERFLGRPIASVAKIGDHFVSVENQDGVVIGSFSRPDSVLKVHSAPAARSAKHV
ncbi:MAG TPA: glutamate racemase [Candidatus Eisenbacteria bacterium]|nr:glutamate racemase [Candidatus Eisenbacteria bacterium]